MTAASRLHKTPAVASMTITRGVLLVACALASGATPASAAEAAEAPRQGSARLDYAPPPGKVRSWYNSVSPRCSPGSTFFAAAAFSFGDMGLHQDGEESAARHRRQAMLSILDDGCEPAMEGGACPEERRAALVECGPSAWCERFDGQGTGMRSTLGFGPASGDENYGFLLRAEQVQADMVVYAGYVHPPRCERQPCDWELLARIRMRSPTIARRFSAMHSFVERRGTRFPEEPRWGLFGPSFVELDGARGEWRQLRTASLSRGAAAGGGAPQGHANMTGDAKRWGLGIGTNLAGEDSGASPGEDAQLRVEAAAALPEELRLFGATPAADIAPYAEERLEDIGDDLLITVTSGICIVCVGGCLCFAACKLIAGTSRPGCGHFAGPGFCENLGDRMDSATGSYTMSAGSSDAFSGVSTLEAGRAESAARSDASRGD